MKQNRSKFLRDLAGHVGIKPHGLYIDGPSPSGFGCRNKHSTRVKYKLVFSTVHHSIVKYLADNLNKVRNDCDIENAYALEPKRTYRHGDHCSLIVWFNSRNS